MIAILHVSKLLLKHVFYRDLQQGIIKLKLVLEISVLWHVFVFIRLHDSLWSILNSILSSLLDAEWVWHPYNVHQPFTNNLFVKVKGIIWFIWGNDLKSCWQKWCQKVEILRAWWAYIQDWKHSSNCWKFVGELRLLINWGNFLEVTNIKLQGLSSSMVLFLHEGFRTKVAPHYFFFFLLIFFVQFIYQNTLGTL